MSKVRLILNKPWMGHWTGDSVEVDQVQADLLIQNGTAAEGPGTRAAGADARVEADGIPPKGEPMVDVGEGTGVGLTTETEGKAIDGPPENKAVRRRDTK